MDMKTIETPIEGEKPKEEVTPKQEKSKEDPVLVDESTPSVVVHAKGSMIPVCVLARLEEDVYPALLVLKDEDANSAHDKVLEGVAKKTNVDKNALVVNVVNDKNKGKVFFCSLVAEPPVQEGEKPSPTTYRWLSNVELGRVMSFYKKTSS